MNKTHIEKNKLIAEEKKQYKIEYLQKLLKIKGDWFDEEETLKNRKQIEK
jgi:hypothetical protein